MTHRPFTPAWLADDPAATRFLPRAFASPAARVDAVRAAAARPITPALLGAIAAQEARRPWSVARARNLELLGRGAAVVVTGQQVGLLLGPLYTLHKAASAIVAARALSEESGHPVVPVFWLQTEDHDFAEVQRVTLPTQGGLWTYVVQGELDEHARVSLAERTLGASIGTVLDSLALQGPHAEAVAAQLARHYRPEATFGEAFGGLMAELFAEHGLLVFDPRAAPERSTLARLAAPVHGFALRGASEIEAALTRRAHELDEAGFSVQVPVRAGAALSCYADGVHAPRHRLERVTGADGSRDTWTTKHLDAPLDVTRALAETPERFTTTALLRPLLQDTLLPTAGYVGGPGELAYFAELHPLYELAGVPMPLAIPRARFTLVTATARRLAEQLGLSIDDAARPKAELATRLAAGQQTLARIEAAHGDMLASLSRGVGALSADAAQHGDHGFDKHAKKAHEQIAHTLERLAERARRAVLESDATTSERLARFQALLAPNGEPQERVLGFAAFAAQVGAGALVDRVVAHSTPFDAAHRTIDL